MAKQTPQNSISSDQSERPVSHVFLDILDRLVLDDNEEKDDKMKDLLRAFDVPMMEKLLDCDLVAKLSEQFPDIFTSNTDDTEFKIANYTPLQEAMMQFVAKRGGPQEVVNFEPQVDVRKELDNIFKQIH